MDNVVKGCPELGKFLIKLTSALMKKPGQYHVQSNYNQLHCPGFEPGIPNTK